MANILHKNENRHPLLHVILMMTNLEKPHFISFTFLSFQRIPDKKNVMLYNHLALELSHRCSKYNDTNRYNYSLFKFLILNIPPPGRNMKRKRAWINYL